MTFEKFNREMKVIGIKAFSDETKLNILFFFLRLLFHAFQPILFLQYSKVTVRLKNNYEKENGFSM